VPGESFGERHVQVVAVGRAAVVGARLGEHVAVAVGVEGAFDDDVVVPGVRALNYRMI
jgi:Ni,Fe-hydrogenase III small subunit